MIKVHRDGRASWHCSQRRLPRQRAPWAAGPPRPRPRRGGPTPLPMMGVPITSATTRPGPALSASSHTLFCVLAGTNPLPVEEECNFLGTRRQLGAHALDRPATARWLAPCPTDTVPALGTAAPNGNWSALRSYPSPTLRVRVVNEGVQRVLDRRLNLVHHVEMAFYGLASRGSRAGADRLLQSSGSRRSSASEASCPLTSRSRLSPQPTLGLC
jgi:hypothetical protein